jgi:hypothetical protein
LNSIKVQTPRGSLENTVSKTVEFTQGKSETKTIFEGKYTAKNRDVYLNSFSAAATVAANELAKFDELTLRVYVNGEEVATSSVTDDAATNTALSASDDFSKVLVKAGESANIEVKAQAYPNALTTAAIEFSLTFE